MDKLEHISDEPGLGGRLLGILLLTRPFEWKVGWSPQKCSERLSELSSPKGGFFEGTAHNVDINEVYDQIYEFEITMIRRNKEDRFSLITGGAYARGVIYMDQALEKTILQGEVRLGDTVYGIPLVLLAVLGLFLTLLFMAALAAPSIVQSSTLGCFVVVLPPVMILLFMNIQQGLFDRSQLYDLLSETFPVENKIKKRKPDG
jgi:hypothetical protein